MRPTPRVDGKSKASVKLDPESARRGQAGMRDVSVVPAALASRSKAAKAMKTKE